MTWCKDHIVKLNLFNLPKKRHLIYPAQKRDFSNLLKLDTSRFTHMTYGFDSRFVQELFLGARKLERENSFRSIVTVSNKKTHLAVFETCLFRVYLRNHLSYKKVIYIYLHPCLKSFQMKKDGNRCKKPFYSSSDSGDIREKYIFQKQVDVFFY